MIFDTSLFEKNDPQLARQVKNIGKQLRTKGVVRISWIDAKALIKKTSEYFKNVFAFAHMENWKKDGKCYQYIMGLLAEKLTFCRFLQIIKASNILFNNINH